MTLGIHQTLVFMKVAKVFIESIHEVYHGIHGPEKARTRKVYMVKYQTNTNENLMNTSETGPFYNKKFLDENQQKPSKNLKKTHEYLCLIFTRVLSGFHDLSRYIG